MATGKSHKKDRKIDRREKESKKIHKPSAQTQPLLISHDKAGYRARLEGCVCFSVCPCLWTVLKENARERGC